MSYTEKPRRASYSNEERSAYAAGVAYAAAKQNKRVVCKNEACTKSFRAVRNSGRVSTFPDRKWKR